MIIILLIKIVTAMTIIMISKGYEYAVMGSIVDIKNTFLLCSRFYSTIVL